MSDKKHYAERDIMNQDEHYTNHVMAMTAEGLHSKSDIAAELAHRDIALEQVADYCETLTQRCIEDTARIGELEAENKRLWDAIQEHKQFYDKPFGSLIDPVHLRLWAALGESDE